MRNTITSLVIANNGCEIPISVRKTIRDVFSNNKQMTRYRIN